MQDYLAEKGDLEVFSPRKYERHFLNSAFIFLQRLKLLEMDQVIDFSGLEIGNLNFKSAHFRFPISFKKTRFLQFANFGHAEFKNTVDFGFVQFDQSAFFEHADFGMRISQMLNLELKETKLKSMVFRFPPLNSMTLQLLIIANFMVKAGSMERCLVV